MILAGGGGGPAAALGVGTDDLGLPPVIEDADGSRHIRAGAPFTPPPEAEGAPATDGSLPGLWLSRYQYWSTGRQGLYISQHHVILTRVDTSITVESIPAGVPPSISMTLSLRRNLLTGTWQEQTDPQGHYLGDSCWGAVQLLLWPSHRYMNGKWVSWGSRNRINTGPWELTWLSADTSPEALAPYARALPDEPVE